MKNIFPSVLIVFTCIVTFSQEPFNTNEGVAIEGYDVVSYFEGKPAKGSKEFSSQLDGITFWFENEDHLFKFNKTPLKYIPQYGGYCAYAMGKSGEKVSINPKAYLIKEGKLYLFYKNIAVNTLKKWREENPQELKEKADKNWFNITHQ
ncbi:MAG: YHS domain-containing (seleno)protein [Flavobacteriaceae bacterium]